MTNFGGCYTTIMNGGPHLSQPFYSAAQGFSRVLPSGASLPLAPSPIKVLIAGDHATLRSSLKTMLELDPRIKVVGEATDDCEAVKMSRKLSPDVVLIDLDMYCCANYDALAEISQGHLATAIVALTIHDDDRDRCLAQAAGANLVLEKGVPYKQLIQAIRLAAANN
ncbi:MAG TPA: response regulator transcription factor [Chloroflexia bacterium]|nr:response regulator transcription factor [Chloroflexia bacterium]